jgi:glycerol uptake facilitator-like aquaporin
VRVEGLLDGRPHAVEVDRVAGATGFRPNLSFLSELRLSLDPAVQATPALAPLIDPNLHSCGTVRPHGEAELRHTAEPGFWIAGMKAYGRAPTFLMATGYEQVRSIAAHLAGDAEAARRVELVLPPTGVCSGPGRAARDGEGGRLRRVLRPDCRAGGGRCHCRGGVLLHLGLDRDGGDRPDAGGSVLPPEGGTSRRRTLLRLMAAAFDLPRRLVAEALGTAILVATVVGSGIMAERLTPDAALALLANTLATGSVLVVLVTTLGPVSGAHLNPAVSLVFALRGELPYREALRYALAQLAGGLAGTVAAHLMFGLALVTASAKVRTGGAQWFSEGVATFGLVLVILAGVRFERRAVPWLVGLYITAAYWFTASTSFANPAVAAARSSPTPSPASARRTSRASSRRRSPVPSPPRRSRAGCCASPWPIPSPSVQRRNRDGHDLPQPGLRHVAQRARDDPRHGVEPAVVEYLRTPPTRAELLSLVRRMGCRSGPCCAEGHALRRARPRRSALSDDALLDAIEAHPILIDAPDRRHAPGRAALPALRGRVGPPRRARCRRLRKEDGERVPAHRA